MGVFGLIALRKAFRITRMNGTELQIEIFKPFGEAFELMKKILFQPFDLKKWLVIGFAAFLASLSGGFTSSFNPLSRWSSRDDNKAIADSFHDVWSAGQMEWWLIVLIIVGALILLAVIFVLTWLGARGRFIFTDCIVRNRAAIVVPWKEFRVEGNSFFLFSVLAFLTLITFAIVGILGLALPLILRGHGARPGTAIADRVLRVLVCPRLFGFWFCSDFAINDPGHVPPTLSGNGRFRTDAQINRSPSGAGAPLRVVFTRAVIAAAMISCAVTCVTCCIAAIPYVGAVILLPIPVTLGGFSLLFLRQFGPDYDVWADFMPPEFLPVLMPPPAPSETEAG